MTRNLKFQRAIGARVKEVRNTLGQSQDEFGFQVGTDRTYVNKIENAAANIGVCKLCEICERAEITIGEFFDSPAFRKTYFEKESSV
ncbi:MAG: helix-turn-helix domain-containing protein [Clostridiales bacterium]|nr:helix-turn-helix domain-containing protein [Clostridiales bacterium]